MLRLFAAKKVAALAIVMAGGITMSGCNWLWPWGSSALPGHLGLGDNDQAYVTLDGIYVDVSIEPAEAGLLEDVASNCINHTVAYGDFDNCMVETIGPFVDKGPFQSYEITALESCQWSVVGCLFGYSLYWATVNYAWGRGGNPPPGCLGFKLNILGGLSYVQGSWYDMSPTLFGGGGTNIPANALCPA
jgi:hypothetical protein